MCHHEGLAGGKHYQKITIPIFRLVFQNVVLPGCFPYNLFYSYVSPYFLLVGLPLQYVALFQSRELVTSQLNRCPHFLCFFFIHFS